MECNMNNSLSKSPDIVVFDLETSGMNCEEDSIIEIGAVKVRGGKVIDEFHYFVACPQPLSKEVEQLTGIKNKDIASAPSVKEVLENFYVFADDCILAAYHLPFQYDFLEYYGKLSGIKFDNERLDILPLVQEKLKEKVCNYKLSTVAENLGIVYNKSNVLGETKAAAAILITIKGFTKRVNYECYIRKANTT